MSQHFIFLQLFADEGLAGSTDVAGSEDSAVSSDIFESGLEGQPDAQAAGSQAPEEETFDSLINGKYKQEYGNAVKNAVQKRFRNQSDLQDKIAKIDPVVRMVAQRYGIIPEKDGSISIDKLQSAIDNDDSIYEKEAFDRGMSVEDYKQMKKLELENQSLKFANEKSQKQREWDGIVAQGEELKKTYPDFDLETEMQNENFGRLFATMNKSGFPNALEAAYKAVHEDEIIGGSMKYAVQRTQEQISKSIQSGLDRPSESGASGQSAGTTQGLDPSKLTKAQLDEIRSRAKNGERITF